MSAFSVVIPAHDEERVIGRLLDGLQATGGPDEAEIVVVCNGCSDRTADVARAFAPQATVLELVAASKTAALNAGDRAASAFPRFYVDADVEVGFEALLTLAGVLREGSALAAAPRLRMDTSRSPWPVRAYYEVWAQLPYVRDEMIGTGVIGLSQQGRCRFGDFPEVIADDMYVQGRFTRSERRTVVDAEFVAHAPRRSADLIRRLTRVHAGTRQLCDMGLTEAKGSHGFGDLLKLARRPRWLAPLTAYVAITIVAKARAARKIAAGRASVWDRDESSRLSESRS
ncbi:MAG: glycosyltransferase [Dermatophilaceae bacterium]